MRLASSLGPPSFPYYTQKNGYITEKLGTRLKNEIYFLSCTHVDIDLLDDKVVVYLITVGGVRHQLEGHRPTAVQDEGSCQLLVLNEVEEREKEGRVGSSLIVKSRSYCLIVERVGRDEHPVMKVGGA